MSISRQRVVLGISGSLRKASWNSGLLRAAGQLLPPNMKLEMYDISSVPLYNQDNDGVNTPEPVKKFKNRVAEVDGILFATPEYNYSIPGVLKNALDWASRTPKDSPLNGKPAAMMGAGGGMGTVRAQLHLRQMLLHNGMLVLSKPEVYIARGWEQFDADGNLTVEKTRDQVKQLLHAFALWMEKLMLGDEALRAQKAQG